jgi:hypothetical protein
VEIAKDRATRTITARTPLDTKVKFMKLSNEGYDADAPRMGSVPYKSTVGSLIYAMVATRAD